MKKTLSCATLGDLANGMFGKLVDSTFDKVLTDLDDRGHDGKVREVTIVVKLSRSPRDGAPTVIDPEVKMKVPALRPMATSAEMKASQKDGTTLVFDADNADNTDQPAEVYEKGA